MQVLSGYILNATGTSDAVVYRPSRVLVPTAMIQKATFFRRGCESRLRTFSNCYIVQVEARL